MAKDAVCRIRPMRHAGDKRKLLLAVISAQVLLLSCRKEHHLHAVHLATATVRTKLKQKSVARAAIPFWNAAKPSILVTKTREKHPAPFQTHVQKTACGGLPVITPVIGA